jgi:hypothetical protein
MDAFVSSSKTATEEESLHKDGSSGRLTVSHSRSQHVRFLSPSRPPVLQQQAAASRLQSISISLLSPGHHSHSGLNYFRIHFVDNKFKKTN